MFEIDWSSLFIPRESLLEIAVRGSVIYLVLFAVVRFLPRRTLGEASASDILVVVLIADAVQDGMAGDYKTISEGIFLAAVIIGWAILIDWLDHRFPDWHLASGKPLALIDNGRLVKRNLDRQLITEDELMAQLRMHGIESPDPVAKAYVEGDGQFSIVLRGGPRVQKPPERRGAHG